MYQNKVDSISQNNIVCDTFTGYSHKDRIYDGQFREQQNMSSRDYPLLSTRKKRLCGETRNHIFGMTRWSVILGGYYFETLVVIFRNKIRYYTLDDSGEYTDFIDYTVSLSSTDKQLVVSGSYLYIWPDKVRINMTTPGTLESLANVATISNAKFTLALSIPGSGWQWPQFIQDTQPESANDGQVWVDISLTPFKIYKYNSEQETWVDHTSDYIAAITMGENHFAGFAVGDYVYVSGFSDVTKSMMANRSGSTRAITDAEVENLHTLDGWRKVTYIDSERATLVGIEVPLATCYWIDLQNTDVSITVSRPVPDMDYICEAQNRLWGCKYGISSGSLVNELYCSALGDARNWYRYSGDSTASWAASCGSDGPWTGCVSYNGYPIFFKERSITKIYISSTGGHQTVESAYPGVQDGSSRSISIVNGVLLYKGVDYVYSYDGSYPVAISAVLGEQRYSRAVSASDGHMYYINMVRGVENARDDSTIYDMFVYDVQNGIWSREDNVVIDFLCEFAGTVFGGGAGNIYCLNADRITAAEGMTKETSFDWYCESGLEFFGWNTSSKYKSSYPAQTFYISRYMFRMELEAGTTVRLLVEYDSSGEWELQGEVTGDKFNTYIFPVAQNRCDHLRYRIEGTGGCKIWMICRKQEEGSDEYC